MGRIGLVCALAFSLLIGPASVLAQFQTDGTTIRVTSTGDDLTVNGNCTLREAIQAANSDTQVDACPAGNDDDTILLPAQTITLSLGPIGEQPDDANLNGDLDITASVTILGNGKAVSVIDANRLERVLDIHGASTRVTLRDLALVDGEAFVDSIDREGGGIYNAGILLLERVRVENCGHWPYNSTVSFGGGLVNEGQVTIRHSDFIGNWVEFDSSGSGIANLPGGVALIEDSVFTRNGAMYGVISNVGQMTIRRTQMIDNSAGEEAFLFGGTTLIEDSLLQSNDGWQGGMLVGGALTIRNSTLSGNGSYARIWGGPVLFDRVLVENQGAGFRVDRGGTLELRNSTVRGTGNEDEYGLIYLNDGTIRIDSSTLTSNTGKIEVLKGTLTLINSTLSGNALEPNIGGSLIEVTGGSLVIESSTVANNHGDYSLDVRSGSASLLNSLLYATHWPAQSNHADCHKASGATLTSRGSNLISIATGCGWTPTNGDLLGSSAAPLDPRIEPLSDNGGLTLTHALKLNSPAMDGGHASLYPPLDQRGDPRPTDGNGDGSSRADIGAFEAPGIDQVKEDIYFYLPMIGR